MLIPTSWLDEVVVGEGVRTRICDTGGAGPTFVLIHGGNFGSFVPFSMESWGSLVAALSKMGRVVAFDKLGQGWTDLPSAAHHWTTTAVRDHARAVMEELDLRDAVVLGHSRGGLTALELTEVIPDRIRALMVISSASAAPLLGMSSDTEFYEGVEQSGPGDAAGMIAHYHAAQAVTEGPLPADELSALVTLMESEDQRFARAHLREHSSDYWLPSLERSRSDLQQRLKASGLPCPTALVWGREDRSAPIRLGRALYELISERTPLSSFSVIGGAGHQVFRDQPALFRSVVTSTLSMLNEL